MGAVTRSTGYGTEAVLFVVNSVVSSVLLIYCPRVQGALLESCIIELVQVILVVMRHATRVGHMPPLHDLHRLQMVKSHWLQKFQ